ncbi:MAG: hypothetical protein ABIR39_19295 [Nocardioides sp.]
MSTFAAAAAPPPSSCDRSGGHFDWWRNGVIHQVHVSSFQEMS